MRLVVSISISLSLALSLSRSLRLSLFRLSVCLSVCLGSANVRTKKTQCGRLAQVVKWLGGGNAEGCILFDEAHKVTHSCAPYPEPLTCYCYLCNILRKL